MLYVTLYFQALRGDSPITTGLAFLTFTVPLAGGQPDRRALATHRSKATLAFAGMVLLATGTVASRSSTPARRPGSCGSGWR